MKVKVFNNGFDGIVFDKDTKLPEQTIVTHNFDRNNIVGKATNFELKEDGIYCDIELNVNAKGLYPAISCNKREVFDIGLCVFNKDDSIKPITTK